MARTTPTLVKGLLEVQDGVDLTPYIDTASQLVTDVCTGNDPSTGNPIGYSAAKLELIERWLAAHFYTVFDNQLSMARAGIVNVTYQGKTDMGLKSSIYGQHAMILDTAGGLAALNNATAVKRLVKVGIVWLGTNPPYGWAWDPSQPWPPSGVG